MLHFLEERRQMGILFGGLYGWGAIPEYVPSKID